MQNDNHIVENDRSFVNQVHEQTGTLFSSFSTANDEQQFVQRVFEVVVVEVAVALFQRRRNVKNRQRIFWRGHIGSLQNLRAGFHCLAGHR